MYLEVFIYNEHTLICDIERKKRGWEGGRGEMITIIIAGCAN